MGGELVTLTYTSRRDTKAVIRAHSRSVTLI